MLWWVPRLRGSIYRARSLWGMEQPFIIFILPLNQHNFKTKSIFLQINLQGHCEGRDLSLTIGTEVDLFNGFSQAAKTKMVSMAVRPATSFQDVPCPGTLLSRSQSWQWILSYFLLSKLSCVKRFFLHFIDEDKGGAFGEMMVLRKLSGC